MTLAGAALTLARKDLIVELRARQAIGSSITLAGVALILVGLAVGPDPGRLRALVPALVWIALLYASIAVTERLERIDRSDDAFSGLWLTLGDRRAIYLGRVGSLTILLAVLQLALWIAAAVLLDLPLTLGAIALVPLAALGADQRRRKRTHRGSRRRRQAPLALATGRPPAAARSDVPRSRPGELGRPRGPRRRCHGVGRRADDRSGPLLRARLAGIRDRDTGLRSISVGTDTVELTPALNIFRTSTQAIATPAIVPGPVDDLYVTLLDLDTISGVATIRVGTHPFVSWIWAGGALIAIGGGLALVARLVRRGSRLPDPVADARRTAPATDPALDVVP